ncbi:hypothetical protein LINGRAHAP2_LOCUS11127 [Linum grandiflorum]
MRFLFLICILYGAPFREEEENTMMMMLLMIALIWHNSSSEENAEIEIDLDDLIVEALPWGVPPRTKTGIVAERRLMYINWVNGVLRQLNSCSKITKFRIWFNLELRCNSKGVELHLMSCSSLVHLSLAFADDYYPESAFDYLYEYAGQLESLALEIHPDDMRFSEIYPHDMQFADDIDPVSTSLRMETDANACPFDSLSYFVAVVE